MWLACALCLVIVCDSSTAYKMSIDVCIALESIQGTKRHCIYYVLYPGVHVPIQVLQDYITSFIRLGVLLIGRVQCADILFLNPRESLCLGFLRT
jgi:hypothetical protein